MGAPKGMADQKTARSVRTRPWGAREWMQIVQSGLQAQHNRLA